MIKRFRNTTFFIAGLLLIAAPSQAQDVKIGLIDFARLQREFYRTDLERQNFEAKRQEERTKVEERRNKLKELLTEQEAAAQQLQEDTFSDAKKEEILKAAQERQGQITSLQRESIEMESRINAELAKMANEIQRSLTKEIYDMIGTIAQEKGYDLVFNRTFGINGVPTLAYSSTGKLEDYTDEVRERLNTDAPEGWEPPKDASAEINPGGQ